eukprot:3603547-Alexandrium_andersonii.AAC.1
MCIRDSSSTRAELLTAIHAHLPPIAVHLVCDNPGVQMGHEAVCRFLRTGHPLGLANKANSDLWEVWAGILRQKGLAQS